MDVKASEMRRESLLATKAPADKRPRKPRPPGKKKGEDGPGSTALSMGGAWSEAMKADGVDQPGAGDSTAGGDVDPKGKAKRKYVRPTKQKVDSGNALTDNQEEGRDIPPGQEPFGTAGDGKGTNECDDDVAAGKRKREGNGKGSRGGKAPAGGKGQKPASSPNAAKRLKAGSPTLDGADAEGAAAREDVSGAISLQCLSNSKMSVVFINHINLFDLISLACNRHHPPLIPSFSCDPLYCRYLSILPFHASLRDNRTHMIS